MLTTLGASIPALVNALSKGLKTFIKSPYVEPVGININADLNSSIYTRYSNDIKYLPLIAISLKSRIDYEYL